MSEETSDAENIALARNLFAATISAVRDRVQRQDPAAAADPQMFKTAIAAHLRQVLNEFVGLAEGGVQDPSILPVSPDYGRPWIVEQGPFLAALRVPGEKGGAESGRAPGLEWHAVDPQSADVPGELKKYLRQIPPGALGALARAQMDFCPDGTLWHLWFPPGAKEQDADAFAIVAKTPSGTNPVLLNWTNEAIYQLNDLRLFRFSKNPHAYIRCFFHIVRAQLGRFTILEHEEDVTDHVPWDRSKPASAIEKDRANILRTIRPLERKSMNAAGEMVFSAIVLFKNALFKTDVAMSPDGQLRLENEELLFEDLAVNMA